MHKDDETPRPSRRFDSAKILIACVAISLLLMFIWPGDTNWVATPRSSLDAAIVGVTGRVGWIARLIVLADESRSFHSKVATDPIFLESLQELKRENLRLRELLGFSQKDGWDAVMAEVVGKETDRLGTVILVNQGSQAGVVEGWIVCSPDGLVGKVSRVRESFSRVQLITNYNSPVSVRVERSGVEAVVEWNPSLPTKLAMKFVQPDSDIKVGDILVSSGLGGVYPAGLKVGRVVRVKIGKEAQGPRIEVQPFVDFSRLAVVLLAAPEKIKVQMLESGLFSPDVD